jgi:hypothetical protein
MGLEVNSVICTTPVYSLSFKSLAQHIFNVKIGQGLLGEFVRRK